MSVRGIACGDVRLRTADRACRTGRRHTIRCGTERIGTNVQTVSVPVRKTRTGRSASERLSQGTPDVSERRAHVGAVRGRSELGEFAGQLRLLPPLARRGAGHREHGVEQAVCPFGRRARPSHQVLRGVEPIDQLGEPPQQVDVGRVDIIDRQHVAESGGLALEGHTQQQTVETLAPGALPHTA